MNQDTSDSNDSVKQVVNPESLYSSLITLANRKRKLFRKNKSDHEVFNFFFSKLIF